MNQCGWTNGNDRVVSRAQSCAEPVANEPEKKPGKTVMVLAWSIVIVALCALVPVALHLLLNVIQWSWHLLP